MLMVEYGLSQPQLLDMSPLAIVELWEFLIQRAEKVEAAINDPSLSADGKSRHFATDAERLEWLSRKNS